MPENSAIEVIDSKTFNVVETIPVRTFKNQYSVDAYKALIAEHQDAITTVALDALVKDHVNQHQEAIDKLSIVLKTAASAGTTDAVQAVIDLGI